MGHLDRFEDKSNHKWYVLGLAALTHTFAVAMPTMCMPVLFKEISEDLGLSLVQIGAVWGASTLTGIFAGLVGGSIGDRFGTRRTLSVACMLAGAAGALRGLSGDFASLAPTVLLAGFLFPTIPTNVHKTCGIWFTGRRLGTANGVVSMGMALGFMGASLISATYLSPWLGGWRRVLFFYGFISVVVGFIWRFVPESPSELEAAMNNRQTTSTLQSLGHVIRLRGVLLIGVAMLGLGGCIQGTLGYLPLYLRGIGWTAANADGALASFHGVSMLATLPIAAMSDRIGLRKPILMTAALMITVGVGLLSVVNGPVIWVSVLMAGMFRDGFMAILMTTIIELEGVAAARAGTATGLVLVFSQFGGALSPALGNSLANIHPSLPFAFWASLGAAALLVFRFIEEGKALRRE